MTTRETPHSLFPCDKGLRMMNVAHSLTLSSVTLASIPLLLSPSQTEIHPPRARIS